MQRLFGSLLLLPLFVTPFQLLCRQQKGQREEREKS
jgi:hypothetical protein